MKKILIVLVILLLAIGAVWLLDYMGQQSPSGHTGTISNNPTVIKLSGSCEDLELNTWNKPEFEKIRSQINMYHTQGLISQVDKISLETRLYSAYAGSLNLAFEDWKSNCARSSVREIYNEIKEISNYNSTCQGKLRQSYTEIKGYYQILNATEKVKLLIIKEFDTNTYNAAAKDIAALPSYYRRCSSITGKINEAESQLTSFKLFVEYNSDHYNAHTISPDSRTVSKLEQDYQKASNFGYTFYKNKLANDGFK